MKDRFLGGRRADGSRWFFNLVRDDEVNEGAITAVCAIVSPEDRGDKVIAIVNQRGCDIPGGHIKEGETPLEAIKRETEEEAHIILINPMPLVYLRSDFYKEKSTFIIIYFAQGKILPFKPTEEIVHREVMDIKDFLLQYFGNKDLMKILISKAYNI